MKKQLLKVVIVILSATAITTIGIFASDALQGITPGAGNFAGVSGACKVGATEFNGPNGILCVDIYEASPSKNCPNLVVRNTLHSEQNLSASNCNAVSQAEAVPWNFVSLSQAQRACARSGKRLPTNDEWYRIALSSEVTNCTINTSSAQSTGNAECVSADGVYDLIGNVWEWVDESIEGNMYKGRRLPESGYVTSVDANGIAVDSSGSPDVLYGADYFWSRNDGVSGMIRGGFYGSGDDAGLYTTNASVPTNLATAGVGFRCVEDVL